VADDDLLRAGARRRTPPLVERSPPLFRIFLTPPAGRRGAARTPDARCRITVTQAADDRGAAPATCFAGGDNALSGAVGCRRPRRLDFDIMPRKSACAPASGTTEGNRYRFRRGTHDFRQHLCITWPTDRGGGGVCFRCVFPLSFFFFLGRWGVSFWGGVVFFWGGVWGGGGGGREGGGGGGGGRVGGGGRGGFFFSSFVCGTHTPIATLTGPGPVHL